VALGKKDVVRDALRYPKTHYSLETGEGRSGSTRARQKWTPTSSRKGEPAEEGSVLSRACWHRLPSSRCSAYPDQTAFFRAHHANIRHPGRAKLCRGFDQVLKVPEADIFRSAKQAVTCGTAMWTRFGRGHGTDNHRSPKKNRPPTTLGGGRCTGRLYALAGSCQRRREKRFSGHALREFFRSVKSRCDRFPRKGLPADQSGFLVDFAGVSR